ncbi:UDP-glucose--hexose-1-phosphate uridylyltransferase [Gaoshiqia sp. Z1-71]|uniref:UDP-glucose--hexose-1-phosphate uridylyltransferase n=1 Tax=Gaoshiqia hydrogeniformans TaxID=3290090 RepID=UPI003BF83285
MSNFNIEDHPHKRLNPLTNDWVLVSPHRAKRPWQGQVEKAVPDERPRYDPACYLCAGNERAGGKLNPDYKGTYVFTNDFSALLTDTPHGKVDEGSLFQAQSERGLCKVICFSENHSLTVPEMEVADIRNVVDVWCEQYAELGSNDFINYVQIFENKGAIMGCSNPHPHGQIWSSSSVPAEAAKESVAQKAYFEKHGATLLGDYLKAELEKQERLLVQNEYFVALVPYWAVWPFETMIISRRPIQNILQLTDEERTGLADIYKQLTVKYDNLFEVSFAYSAGLHQAPTDGNDYPEWHLHMHFYPPLLRSASVKKFMVGYEMLASPQRDITAEQAAKRLRDLPDLHYKKQINK